MQSQIPTTVSTGARPTRGFTLVEVVFALAIVVIVFSGVIVAYTQASYRAQWTGYSLAAEALAIKQIEQARCARWDPADPNGAKIEIYSLNLQNSNLTGQVLTGYTWTNLDLPSAGNSNSLRATNYVTVMPVTPVPSTANGSNIMVKIDTVWAFTWKKSRLYTNTVCTYLAPDNKEPSDLGN